MSIFTVSKDDLIKRKLIDEGWYPMYIESTTSGKSKDSGAMTCTVKFRVTGGPREGHVIETIYSEKFISRVIELFEGITGTELTDPGQLDLSKLARRPFLGYVSHDSYGGETNNRVTGAKPPDTVAA